MFHEFTSRYMIEGQLCATTAIHIGAAEDTFKPGGNKNPFFRNAQGLPMIPGSSLKGAMRSMLEQFLLSEMGEEVFGGKACSEADPCINDKNKKYKDKVKDKTEEELSNYLFAEDSEGRLCMVCRLFGSKASSAKLHIRDAKVEEETFQNEFEVRSGNAIDRELGKSMQGHLYEVEVVPEGTVFSFRAILENAEDEEWNCVKMLLLAMESGFLMIGGMKSRGLGGIELQNIKYQKIDKENIKQFLTGGEIEIHELGKKNGGVC